MDYVSAWWKEGYREWITRVMHGENHRILFDLLHDTEFVWDEKLPRDEHRAMDGIFLRNVFSMEAGLEEPDSARDWPCSFLEFLVALSMKAEDHIAYDPESDTDASTWFWEFLDNINLARCDDAWFMESQSLGTMMVFSALDTVLRRQYGKDGVGGLFPLKDPPMDQRKEEIWFQVNDYFYEKSF